MVRSLVNGTLAENDIQTDPNDDNLVGLLVTIICATNPNDRAAVLHNMVQTLYYHPHLQHPALHDYLTRVCDDVMDRTESVV